MCQIFSCTSHWHFPILPCKTTLILFKYASSPCPATTYLIQAKVFIALNESWWTYPLVLIAPGMWSSVNREMWRKIWWKTLRKDFARADTLKPYSQKTSQSNHTRTTALSNSMKPRHVRGEPKTGGSWWRGLTECGPLEKGMANHFSIFALRTPWTVWKGKMIGYWKRYSPGQ